MMTVLGGWERAESLDVPTYLLTASAQLGSQCYCNSSNILECRVWRKLLVEAEPTLYKHCTHSCTHTGNTLEIHWKYTENTPEIHWNYTGNTHCLCKVHAHCTQCTHALLSWIASPAGLQIPSAAAAEGKYFWHVLTSPLNLPFFGNIMQHHTAKEIKSTTQHWLTGIVYLYFETH